MRVLRLLAVSLVATMLTGAICGAQTEITWDAELYDPAGNADLVLPMGCGGAMAFQRVAVPVAVEDPLDDRAFRMGQSQPETGFSDYLNPTHLRGAFTDESAGVSYYFIARYELTEGQYRALTGDCAEPFTRRDRFAHGEMSWFEAIDLTRRYTEWLLANAPDVLPHQGDRRAFLRLPTEAEWEFAARGGIVVDPAQFPARRFFAEGSLSDYAQFQAGGQGRGKLLPVGLRQPNPLGLFDIYGNAEELMLEPFRLNDVGRPHGQAGGIVTRGGSIDAEEAQIYTAQRREYPQFNPQTGQALAGAFFGLRAVISAHVVTDAAFPAIVESWKNRAEANETEIADPSATLSELLEEEVDPRRQTALSELQLEFRVAREAADASLLQAAKSTLLSGAAFVDGLIDDAQKIALLDSAIRTIGDRAVISSGEQRTQLIASMRANVARLSEERQLQQNSLLYYRSTLETLVNDVPSATREAAYLALGRDLGASEQLSLLDNLNRFWGDVGAYAAEPDMSQDDLLTMALN